MAQVALSILGTRTSEHRQLQAVKMRIRKHSTTVDAEIRRTLEELTAPYTVRAMQVFVQARQSIISVTCQNVQSITGT
jgi:hypothetical protein